MWDSSRFQGTSAADSRSLIERVRIAATSRHPVCHRSFPSRAINGSRREARGRAPAIPQCAAVGGNLVPPRLAALLAVATQASALSLSGGKPIV